MKNTFSFRHDYGARNDPKIRRMVNRLGAEAGWAWWIIVEELYEQGGRLPLDAIPDLAYDAHVSEEVIEKVIRDFGLFKIERKEFYSERICWELSDKEDKSSAAKKSAAARWDKYKKDKELENNKDANACANASKNDANAYTNAQKSDAEADTLVSKTDAKIKGNEIKGNEDIDACASSPQGEAPDTSPKTDKGKIKSTNQVMELWNRMIDETGAPLRKIARFTEKRKKKVQVRWREFMEIGDPTEVVLRIFQNACTSKFFQGDNKTGWSGDFDWLFENEKNWVKTYEGKYDEHRPNNAQGGRSQLHIEATKPEDFEGDF